MPIGPTTTPGPRRPAGVNRFGLVVGSLATAGTLAVAFVGLGGPPAPASTVAPADAAATGAPAPRVVVQTVYVQLPAPTAAPVAAVRKAASAVVTRQSGSGGGEGGENEGSD